MPSRTGKRMNEAMTNASIPSSFRDPSGFLFEREGSIYRQVNTVYKEDYDELMNSGLYEDLVDSQLLVPHKEVDIECPKPDQAYKIIKPELISFISYPYEWCFSELKDAALTTLQIQKKALEHGMSLKDCSAYNVQFRKSRPIFIDTLSFEKYKEGQPWVAYRQFCQHFLAPLALMSYGDVRLNQFFRIYIDGVPLDLASSLLPFKTRLRFSLLTHIHLHAKSQQRYADKPVKTNKREMSRLSFEGMVDSLESIVKKLQWEPQGTEWADYYEDTNYSSAGLQHKEQVVADFLQRTAPKNVWDLGANIGKFSRITGQKGIPTASFDIDPVAVEKNYLECSKNGETNTLPLLLDLTNPSPGIGWKNEERVSLIERGPTDTVLALALIHHLAISNNLPFEKIAIFFAEICNSLVIEFVPKNDSQVQRLLATREDIFPDYTREAFEVEFGKYFEIEDSAELKDSERIMYLMRGRQT